ncbi:MAG: ubiquitin-like domain-containing protein [Candidatus Heimdallarchaeota archaeon]
MIVRVVSAIGGGVIDCEVKPNSTISELKRETSRQKRIPASAVIVVFRGRQLDDNETFEEVGITDYEKVYLIARTEGG